MPVYSQNLVGYDLSQLFCTTATQIVANGGLVNNNTDGTISVFIPSGNGLQPLALTKQCCEALGINAIFDTDKQQCRWAPIPNSTPTGTTGTTSTSTCGLDTVFKLVLNPNGNDGSLFFEEGINETCSLSISFDYLFKFKAEVLNNLIQSTGTCTTPVQALEILDISMTLDVINGNTTNSIAEFPILPAIGSGNLVSYLSTHADSGLFICGDPVNGDPVALKPCTPLIIGGTNVYTCNTLIGLIQSEISNASIPNNSFNSNWLTFNTLVTDPAILGQIKNKKIKISIKVNNACVDFCVLMDNIGLDMKCSSVEKTDIYLTKSPGFKLNKVRDNKKSWINNTTPDERKFGIRRNDGSNPIRLTDYNANDERLVINSKEIDLDISLASAIETDVWNYIVANSCLLTGTTIIYNCYSGVTCGDNSIDFSSLLTQPLSAITTVEDFENTITAELVDAKDRKTLSGYPTLRALYDRYLNSAKYCSQVSGQFDYLTIDQFANLVGNYWVDIIEQVIPATTIWGATKIYSNTIFDEQKFKYKAYTLLAGNNPFNGIKVSSPVSGSSTGVSVSSKVITGTGNTTTEIFTNPYIIQMNSGSEFIGTVSIIGTGGNQNNQNGQTLFAG